MSPGTRLLTSMALCAVLASCRADLAGSSLSSFQLGAMTMNEATPAQASSLPLGHADTSSSGPSAPTEAPISASTLTVDLAQTLASLHAPSGLHLLAATDLNHVVVTLNIPGQSPRMRVVTRKEIDHGQKEVVFVSVPPGHASITVTAYNPEGATIGTATQDAVVVPGKGTIVSIHALPAALPSSPSSGSSTHGSGGASPTTMSPSPTAAPAAAGTILKTFETGGRPIQSLFADPAGRLYAYKTLDSGEAVVYQYSADGQLVGSFPIAYGHGGVGSPPGRIEMAFTPQTGGLWYAPGPKHLDDTLGDTFPAFLGSSAALVLDPSGDAFFVSGKYVRRCTPMGDVTSTAIQSDGGLVIDSAGRFWTTWRDSLSSPTINQLRTHAADGTLLQTVTLPYPGLRLKADTLGNIWVLAAGKIFRVDANGTIGPVLDTIARDFVVDPLDRVWLAGVDGLTLLSSDSAVLHVFSVPGHCVARDEHTLWVTNGSEIMQVAP